jgi:hypothetical protein
MTVSTTVVVTVFSPTRKVSSKASGQILLDLQGRLQPCREQVDRLIVNEARDSVS